MECIAFDLVRVLVTLAIVAPQAKQLVRAQRTDGQDYREIKRIEVALPSFHASDAGR